VVVGAGTRKSSRQIAQERSSSFARLASIRTCIVLSRKSALIMCPSDCLTMTMGTDCSFLVDEAEESLMI